MTSFNLGSKQAKHTQLIDPSHPAVVRAIGVVADQGVIPFGTLLAEDVDHKMVIWDGATGVPKGVLTEDCDTATEGLARVLVHGIAVKEHLGVNGVAITADQLVELEDIGIWAN